MTLLAIIPSAVALTGFAANELHVWRTNKNSSRDLARGQKKSPPPRGEGVQCGDVKLP